MSRLIFLFLYIGLGVLAYYFQPVSWPIYLGPAIISGTAILHLGLLLHYYYKWRRDEMATLRAQIAAMMRNQRRLDDDIQRLRSALSSHIPDEKFSGMVAEVKILQGLIERLYDARKAPSSVPSSLTPPKKPLVLDDESILNILKQNLRDDEIELALQPIVTLPQRRRAYYECFSRLRTPDGQLLVPEHYLGIAEAHQLIGIIDNTLLLRCIQLLRKVQRQEKNVGFFLNISHHTLSDRTFFSEFISIMSDNVMLAPSLIFELPQRALSSLSPPLMRDLEQLAQMGYRYSLDQVESLEISASSLSDLGFRFMKVGAGQLLRLAQQEQESPRNIKRMLDLHGIDLIAEHIETERDLVELLDFDIEFGQGYLFGAPRLPRQYRTLTTEHADH